MVPVAAEALPWRPGRSAADYFSTTDLHGHPNGWHRDDFLVRGWSGERQCYGRQRSPHQRHHGNLFGQLDHHAGEPQHHRQAAGGTMSPAAYRRGH